MPWFRKKVDPNVEAAKQEVKAVMPPGWELRDWGDSERFSLPEARITVWGAWASGDGKYAIAFGRDEADAYRQVAARLQGRLEKRIAWRPPMEWHEPKPTSQKEPGFHPYDLTEEDEVARRELDAALPDGWVLWDSDRERFSMPDYKLESWAMSAMGPSGEMILTMGIGLAGSLRALRDALEGRLEEAPYWAPDFPEGL